MPYEPSRGGHAPSGLRDAFLEFIEDLGSLEEYRATIRDGVIEVDEKRMPVRWVLGRLWNCTDILASADCATLDLPRGSTYAQAVRWLCRPKGLRALL